MATPVVAMQMYTLRDLAKQDYAGTLRQVANLGYKAVQVSGFGNSNPKEIRKVLDDLELGSAGTHLGLALFEKEFETVVAHTKDLRAGYAIVPSLPEDRRRTADDWRRLGDLFSDFGRRLKAVGLGFAYHNHAFEFQKFDGRYGYDILFDSVDLEVVQTELDTYWVQYGGADPVQYLEKFAGHIQIVHLKDMGAGPDRPMVPVGDGILPWPKILAASKKGGAEFLCIEQDNCAPLSPLEAARRSLENCRRWGLV